MTSTQIVKPAPTEYANYYAKYIALVPEGSIIEVLARQQTEWIEMLQGIPDQEANRRHPPYTWSVKEVVGHVIDAERIFGYRALRFARHDETALPGFDEQPYVKNAGFDSYKLEALTAEFESLRQSHLWLFRGLQPEAWSRHGVANGDAVSVRAIAYIIAGHAQHHGLILSKRLGKSFPAGK